MDTNPYRAPHADVFAETIERRPWFRLMLGTCCFGTTLLIAAISLLCLSAPANVERKIVFLLTFGILASSTTLMGAGIVTKRDRVALAGLLLFFAPLGVLVAMWIVQIAGS